VEVGRGKRQSVEEISNSKIKNCFELAVLCSLCIFFRACPPKPLAGGPSVVKRFTTEGHRGLRFKIKRYQQFEAHIAAHVVDADPVGSVVDGIVFEAAHVVYIRSIKHIIARDKNLAKRLTC
jgi:hypothetical protein